MSMPINRRILLVDDTPAIHEDFRKVLCREAASELDDFEAVGRTHVVSRAHQTARGRGSGIPVEMWIAYLWDVRDGQATALHLYPTRDEAVEVAERRERDASE